MSITEIIKADFLAPFETIDLETLNNKAPMLTRLDNKYIIKKFELRCVFKDLSESFDVLEIDQKRTFGYETSYFDDADYSCYYSHHQGRRQRVKVRTRKYLDANIVFLETKVKDIRGVTIKKRLPHKMEDHGVLDFSKMQYVQDIQMDHYQKCLTKDLKPTLTMSYERITLVAKDGGERLTIDSKIKFYTKDVCKSIPDDIYIVETKSRNANGVADAVMRKHHQRPTKKCSKYCMGMAITGQVTRNNNFLPALRRLGWEKMAG